MPRPKGSKNGQRTLIEFTCERCGKPFSRRPSAAKNARFCSMECYKPKAQTVYCETCGKPYTLHPSERGRFCSNKCKRNRVEKICPACGKAFSVKASHAQRRVHCSHKCRKVTGQASCECLLCGKTFTVNAAREDNAKYCSLDCYNTSLESHRVTITCAYCGKQRVMKKHRVTGNAQCCCNRCATLYRMEHGFDPGYIGNKRRTGYRTDIEAMTEAVLLELGIPYMFEHKVGRYSVDFILPMIGVALECDGWQHLTAKGRERDIKRDAILQSEGWEVVHVADKDIRRSPKASIRKALKPYIKLP